MKNLTTKQFGDACERFACAELSFSGYFAFQVPENEPDYDIVARTSRGILRVSVKGLRWGSGQGALVWTFDPDNWDWIVLARVNEINKGDREFFVLPREAAMALSKQKGSSNQRRLRYSESLRPYCNNFAIESLR